MKRILCKIFLIALSALFIWGIVYIYTTFHGNPLVKYMAGQKAEKYIELKYSQNYSVGEVGYNFKNKSYPIEIINAKDSKNIGIHYSEGILWDHLEEKILEDKLDRNVSNSLTLFNFKYKELSCSANTAIAARQSFKLNEQFERHDFAYINIVNKTEISKEQFSNMVFYILPVIKAVIIYGEGSEIGITYQFEKQNQFHYFNIKIKDNISYITKDHIMKNTTLSTY